MHVPILIGPAGQQAEAPLFLRCFSRLHPHLHPPVLVHEMGWPEQECFGLLPWRPNQDWDLVAFLNHFSSSTAGMGASSLALLSQWPPEKCVPYFDMRTAQLIIAKDFYLTSSHPPNPSEYVYGISIAVSPFTSWIQSWGRDQRSFQGISF